MKFKLKAKRSPKNITRSRRHLWARGHKRNNAASDPEHIYLTEH